MEKIKWNEKKRIAIFEINEVLNNYDTNNLQIINTNEGEFPLKCVHFNVYKKSLICPDCKLEPKFFALERDANSDQKYYNYMLYGMKDGKEVLFNVDHIIPKSKGGGNDISNLQTMCYYCNVSKGNRTFDLVKFYILTIHRYYKNNLKNSSTKLFYENPTQYDIIKTVEEENEKNKDFSSMKTRIKVDCLYEVINR